MRDLKSALRTLVTTPFVTMVAILSLALGIGANAAIFSLLDEMLLRSLPVRDPGDLVNLGAPGPKPGSQSCSNAGDCSEVFSYPMFRDLEQKQTTLAGIAAHRTFSANLVHAGQTTNATGLVVSGSYFGLLGVRPALGRLIDRNDDRIIGEHPVVVLGYDYWANKLGADPAVLNQSLIVNGHPLTIIGVTERRFTGTTLGIRPDVYVPITMRGVVTQGFTGFENRRNYWIYLFGRLKPGVSLDAARSELQTLYSGLINEVEVPLQTMSARTLARFRAKKITVTPGRRGQSSMHDDVGTPVMLLFAITALVLLIACANIANLLLAKGAARGHEMAIRGSLGATRRQLVTGLLVESLILAAAGGLASILVAYWTLGIIRSFVPAEAAAALRLNLNPSALAFTAALAVGTGLFFGLYPALHATRPDLMRLVRSATGQTGGGRTAARFRTSLVIAQVASSLALLVGAGLFVQSLTNVTRIDLGIDTNNVITFAVSPHLNGYESERTLALFAQLEQELAALPGVSAVTSGTVPLLGSSNWGRDVSVEGFESGPDIDDNSNVNSIGPAYFSTLGIALRAGREFTEQDSRDAPRVAIVNEAFTRKFGLDARTAIGKRMSQSKGATDLNIEIVGVVADAKYSEVRAATPPVYFIPYRQGDNPGRTYFYIRANTDPGRIMRGAAAIVKKLDPGLPLEELKTLHRQVQENVLLDRMMAMLSAAFAVLATLLAAIGLYGVLAYTVARRTREFGLRMALGADTNRVRRMVLRQVGGMLLAGGALGLGAAVVIGRLSQSLLFEVKSSNPWTMLVAVALLSAVALAAGYLPARKASNVNPMEALRYE